jgi:taurine--2-oxoglutarate transaminase
MKNNIQNRYEEIVRLNQKYTYFSWLAQGSIKPLVLEKGKGIYVWDYLGKKYMDFSSQLVLTNIGHGDERISQAIIEQMQKIHYVNPTYATEIRGKLGQKLAEITPAGLEKTLFTLGGAEAIENALKMAKMVTGKNKILARYRSYHGGTYASASVGGDPRRNVIGEGMSGVIHLHDPYVYRSPIYDHLTPEQGDDLLVSLIEETIKLEGPDSIAAILLEGYSGSSGVIAPTSKNYFKKIRKLCDQNQILLIIDEVMSGFGRTGKWFGIDHYDVKPDIMVMAKGLTSGYLPLGGVITSDAIAKYFDDHLLQCGLTYSAHATSCAAALATIKVYEDDQLIENAEKLGLILHQKLNAFKNKHPSLGDVRGIGLHFCLELVKNKKTKEELSPWNKPSSEAMIKLNQFLRDNGLLTMIRWNHLYLTPPLSINETELMEGLEIYDQALSLMDQYTTEH